MNILCRFVLKFLLTCVFHDSFPVFCYICSTPSEWMTEGESAGSSLSASVLGKWPGGVVKFYLNESLTAADRLQVGKAMEEYQTKTCIQFESKSDSDVNYVSIERDDSVCGEAQVCVRGGYQFAKFGKNCRNKNNMIHQLGHALCLTHENGDRKTRDSHTYAHGSCTSTKRKTENVLAGRIYDQASQMHFGCDSDNKCGYQITSGLSVLDSDHINALYNCQGCHRHRWIPEQSLDYQSNNFFFSFGYADLNGQAMYPCRALFGGMVGIGKHDRSMKTCYVEFDGQEYKVCENFEVFTVPSGLRTTESEYMLSEGHAGMSVEKEKALYKNAVVAGDLSFSWTDGSGANGHGYVAFGSIPNLQTSCNFDSVWWRGGSNRKLDVIGRVWRFKNVTQARASLCKKQFPLTSYYILTCKAKNIKRSRLGLWFPGLLTDENADGFSEITAPPDNFPVFPVAGNQFPYIPLENSDDDPEFAAPDSRAVSDETIKSEFKMTAQQQTDEQSNYFMPGFITGFLVFGALLAALFAVTYFGNGNASTRVGFGHESRMPIYFNGDDSFED